MKLFKLVMQSIDNRLQTETDEKRLTVFSASLQSVTLSVFVTLNENTTYLLTYLFYVKSGHGMRKCITDSIRSTVTY